MEKYKINLMMKENEEEVKKKILEKIRKARGGGDDWFKKYYLDDLRKLETLRNKFGISELKEKEIEKLPDVLKRFVPYACKNCGYDGEIQRRVFKIGKLPRNKRERKELKRYMKRKYNIYYFKLRNDIEMTTINSGKCPRCESQYAMFDYGLFMRRPKGYK